MHLNKTQTPASTDLGEMLRSPRTPEGRGQGGSGGLDFASHVQALRREPMQERTQTQSQTQPQRAEAPRTPERAASAPAPSAQDSRAASAQKTEAAAADDETTQASETGPRSKVRTAAKPALIDANAAAAIKPEVVAQATLDADPALQLGEELLVDEAPQDSETDAEALSAALNPNTVPVAQRPETLAPKTAAAKPTGDSALKEALSAVEASGAGKAASEPTKKATSSATSVAQEAHAEAAAAPVTAANQAVPPSTAALVSSMNSSQILVEGRRGEAGVGAATPLHSAATAAAALSTGSTEPTSESASLATPPGTPGFSDELGTQLLVWVKAGVQQAELRLNPAEMGPVQVRIQLDGQQAQVQFGAEQAQTREALEASLPELARALEREGLQWQGGGVQSQLQQQQQQQRQSTGETQERSAEGGTSRRAAAEALSPAAAQPRALRGLVDLYA